MRRRRHRRGGGEEDPAAAEPAPAEPASPEPSIWDKMSTTVGDFTKDVTGSAAAAVAPMAETPPMAEASGGRRSRRSRGGSGHSHGVATYATAVGGRRRCLKGGSHGVGVAAYASPYTQGGGKRRRRRTRRRHYKK